MSESNSTNDSARRIPIPQVSRRAWLVGGTSVVTAGIAGLTAGIGVGAHEGAARPQT
jgi:hypothetical protein